MSKMQIVRMALAGWFLSTGSRMVLRLRDEMRADAALNYSRSELNALEARAPRAQLSIPMGDMPVDRRTPGGHLWYFGPAVALDLDSLDTTDEL